MQALESHCLACGGNDLLSFYEQRDAPLRNAVLLASRAEALDCPRAAIRLAFCTMCGFIQNVLFSGQDAGGQDGGRADASPGTAPQVEPGLNALAASLVERYDLRHKTVLDIGNGTSEFLSLLCKHGQNRGVGIDPGWERFDIEADFICSRHTLAHVQPVLGFVEQVRRSLGASREPVVFFQEADARRMLVELAFWEVSGERCSYFSTGSLARLLRRCGFDLFDLRPGHANRDILADAVASGGSSEPYWPAEDDLDEMRALVRYFSDHHAARLLQWRRHLKRARNEGRRAVIWGSGPTAVSFLTNLALDDAVRFAIDTDPHRQGRYLPGTGHEVASPDALSCYRPDLVIGMDRGHEPEIRRQLSAARLTADVIFV